MLDNVAENDFRLLLGDWIYNQLLLAIIFHDIVYDPSAPKGQNERLSYDFFKDNIAGSSFDYNQLGKNATYFNLIEGMIMATVDHNIINDTPDYIKAIILADLDRFNHPFEQVWQYTVQLFKEYAFVDWADFKEGRLKFLESYKEKITNTVSVEAGKNVEKIAVALSVWEPKIAIFAGSFNPFHIGHLNILEKAEKIFDKVIVAAGINPEKEVKGYEIPEFITKNYQVDLYDGLLTDYIESKPYSVTLVRGLRNSTDLQAEITQSRYLQDLLPEIKITYVVCDSEFEHVSSTGVRLLNKYNKGEKYTKF